MFRTVNRGKTLIRLSLVIRLSIRQDALDFTVTGRFAPFVSFAPWGGRIRFLFIQLKSKHHRLDLLLLMSQCEFVMLN